MTVTQEELARRLREAREAAGFSQEQVAKALHLVRPTIAQIEAGKRKVSSIELAALARLYGRPLQSFFEEPFEEDGVSFILRSIPEIKTNPEIQKALSRGMEIISSILDLENKLSLARMSGVPATSYSKKIQTKWEAIQHGQEVAAQERGRLNLGMAPVPDPAAILDRQGILILGLELPAGISGFTFRSGQAAVCAVNTTEPRVRQRYSLVHEYCHILCDINEVPAIITRVEGEKDLREVRADVFAANFLMPEEAIKDFLLSRGKGTSSRVQATLMVKEKLLGYEARRSEQARKTNYIDVVQLANYFGVSVESIIWRLRNLNFINEQEQKDLLEKDRSGAGKVLKKYFVNQSTYLVNRNKFIFQSASERLMSLAIEAAWKDLISRNKLIGLLKLAGMTEKDIFEFPEARRALL